MNPTHNRLILQVHVIDAKTQKAIPVSIQIDYPIEETRSPNFQHLLDQVVNDRLQSYHLNATSIAVVGQQHFPIIKTEEE